MNRTLAVRGRSATPAMCILALLCLTANSAAGQTVAATVQAFNLDQRESDIQALIARYGEQYVSGQADLQLIAQIRSLVAEAVSDPSNSTSLNNQALNLMEELADRTPPWLYGSLTPIPDRTIVVADAYDYGKAVVRSQPGDEIIVKNGFYEIFKDLTLNGTVAKPIVVRAETPGGVQLYGSSQISLAGSNFILEGIVLRETTGQGVMISGTNVRATQCAVMGGSDASWFAGSNVRMDHMYWGAGSLRTRRFHLPGYGSNRFGKNILDSDFFGTRRLQPGPSGLFDEMIYMNTDTDGLLRNNEYVHIVNSLIDGWYGEGDMAIKGGIQMFNSTARDVPNQLLGHNCENVVFTGNYLFNQYIRMPGCIGRVFSNNYMEGGTIDYEKIDYTNPISDFTMSNNTFIDMTYWTRYISGLPAFVFTVTDNLAIDLKHQDDGYNPTGWLQEGNVSEQYIPTLGSGWSVQTVAMKRDEFGVQRPVTPASFGFQRTDPPYTNYDKRIGPSYLPASVRANLNLISDYPFDADLATGQTSSTAESTWGTIVRHLTLYSNGQPTDLHSKGGMGVSGNETDYAFDNTGTDAMGGKGGVAVSDSIGNGVSRGFTVLGWFKTSGEPIGKGAVVFESGNVTLSAPAAGILQLELGSTKLQSPAVYSEANVWIFFAVTFQGCDIEFSGAAADWKPGPCAKQVTFYKGERNAPVTAMSVLPAPIESVTLDRIAIGAESDGSSAFRGWLDDFKLYLGVLSDSTGPGDVLRRGTVSLANLEEIRQSDVLGNVLGARIGQ